MRWKYTIDLSSLWSKAEKGETPVYDMAQLLISELKKLPTKLQSELMFENMLVDLENILESDDRTSTDFDAFDFDQILENIYDFGDHHRIWVKKFENC